MSCHVVFLTTFVFHPWQPISSTLHTHEVSPCTWSNQIWFELRLVLRDAARGAAATSEDTAVSL